MNSSDFVNPAGIFLKLIRRENTRVKLEVSPSAMSSST